MAEPTQIVVKQNGNYAGLIVLLIFVAALIWFIWKWKKNGGFKWWKNGLAGDTFMGTGGNADTGDNLSFTQKLYALIGISDNQTNKTAGSGTNSTTTTGNSSISGTAIGEQYRQYMLITIMGHGFNQEQAAFLYDNNMFDFGTGRAVIADANLNNDIATQMDSLGLLFFNIGDEYTITAPRTN